MKWLLVLASICMLASTGYAYEVSYGWEDCGTILGMYPDGYIIPTNVETPVHSGSRALQLEDNHPSGTPQAFVAYIYGLTDGDQVYVSFWRYDVTPGAAPSCRIWAHWNDSDPPDIGGYNGSAGGNDDYGPGTGWDMTDWTWTVADGHTGIVIECRTYSNPGDIVWIDDMYISAPDHATILVPEPGPSATEKTSWGSIKSLYR